MQSLFDKIWRVLASIKTGMVLIALVALANLVGSFILQRNQVPPGEIERRYGEGAIAFMEALDLFDLYHSWWFILLLTMTAISLVIASIDIWPRFWARVRAWQPQLTAAGWAAQPLQHRFKVSRQDYEYKKKIISNYLRKNLGRPWETEQKGEHDYFAQRGRWSHLAVFVIHLGLLLVLLGGFIGMRYGYEGQLRLREGQESHLFIDERGLGQARPLGFTVRANHVWMETYPDGSPKAYYSELDILEAGEVVKSKTIRVNEPLSHRGIYFYQATFGTEGVERGATVALSVTQQQSGQNQLLEVPIGGSIVIPGTSTTIGVVDYTPNFQVPLEGQARDIGQGVRIQLKESDGEKNFWVFKSLPDFDRDVRKGRYAIVLQDVKPIIEPIRFTGLAVGHNPGIWTVWTGSGILLVGLTWVIFGSHRKLWVQLSGDNVRLAGTSQRGLAHYRKRFEKIAAGLEEELGCHLSAPDLAGQEA